MLSSAQILGLPGSRQPTNDQMRARSALGLNGRSRFLNERPVWGAVSINWNGEYGRKADLIELVLGGGPLAQTRTLRAVSALH